VALKYSPREQFIPLHNRKQRWAAVNTHRRAGKTVALVNDLIFGGLECQKYKPQLAYIGPTYSQAKRVAWTYLKDYAEPYLGKPPQEAELKVTLKNEATIYVLGADNADSLRGMYLDGTVNDEYALFKPSVFSQVIRPALSDRHGWSVFVSTPRGKNLFYDVCEQARKNPHDWFSLTLPADTSGIIPYAELMELRRDMDPEEFAQEYLCSFDSALKGAIYASEVNQLFIDSRARDGGLFDKNLPTHCAFDLGFTDATVCIWFQLGPDNTVRIVACEATTGVDIFHHIEKINQFEGELGEVFLPHDARAKNLQTGKSIVEQFLKENITPRIVPAHKVRDGIAAVRRLFPLISIDTEATGDLVEAMKSYRREWDDNKLMFSDTPYHDWSSDYCDCLRYMAMACAVLGFTGEGSVLPSKRAKMTDIEMLTASSYNLNTLFEDYEANRSIRRIA
jgi:phage terminase large subunit